MKKITSILFLSLLFLFNLKAQDTLLISNLTSSVEWIGEKVTGQHSGIINLQSAFLLFEENKLIGGEFVMDMGSIQCTDIENPKYAKKLDDHLKNDDFFAVNKFPIAKFTISKVIFDSNAYIITGKMIIKNISQEISFPANFHTNDSVFHADANLKIDRTKHDIKYGSSSFFDELGDRMIYDEFILKIHLQAIK